jgi:hypothetical protein
MEVVRYFNGDEGVEDMTRGAIVDGMHLETVPRQHRLLGWHLGTDALDFLDALGADLDVDEHG